MSDIDDNLPDDVRVHGLVPTTPLPTIQLWTSLQRFLLNMMGVPTQIQPGQVQPPIAEQMVLPVQRRRHERLIQIDQPDPEKADA